MDAELVAQDVGGVRQLGRNLNCLHEFHIGKLGLSL